MLKVFTASGPICLPDNQLHFYRSEYRYEAVRGFCSFLATFDGNECIGWTDTRALGFEFANQWSMHQLATKAQARIDAEKARLTE